MAGTPTVSRARHSVSAPSCRAGGSSSGRRQHAPTPSPARASGPPPPCSPGRRSATALFLALLRRARGRSARAPPGAGHAARLADRRRLPRGGGDRGQGRERARARLAARPARADRRRRRRRRVRTPTRPPPARGRRAPTVVLELPRGGKVRAQDAAVRGRERRLLAFSDANALWEPGALRALAARVRRSRTSATPAGRCAFVNDGRHQPGGPLLALRDVDARARVGARVGDGRQRRDLRRAPRGLPRRSTRVMGHDLSLPFRWSSAACARRLRPRARARRRRWSPTIEGEWAAQAADDGPRVADRPARRAAGPARLPAAVRAHDRSRTGCCATRRRCCTCSPSPPRSRCRAGGCTGSAALAQLSLLAARRGGRPVRARPLLVARYYVLTTASLAAGLYD